MFLHHKYYNINYYKVMNYNNLPFNIHIVNILTDLNIQFNIHDNKIHFNNNFEYLSTYKHNIDIDGAQNLFNSLNHLLFYLNSLDLSISYIGFDDIIIIENQFVFINPKKIFEKVNNSIIINKPYNKQDITLPPILKINNKLPMLLDFEKGVFYSIGMILDIIIKENNLNKDTLLSTIVEDCLNGNCQNILV